MYNYINCININFYIQTKSLNQALFCEEAMKTLNPNKK